MIRKKKQTEPKSVERDSFIKIQIKSVEGGSFIYSIDVPKYFAFNKKKPYKLFFLFCLTQNPKTFFFFFDARNPKTLSLT